MIIFISLIFYWKKGKQFSNPVGFIPSTKVTVIVPVRNEAENIQSCIESLIAQNYPKELFEIIIVDDQSYDETPDILEALTHPNIKCMRLGVEKRTTIEGSKKKAIAYGVNHANGELIVTTDGDCILPENWLKTLVAYYEKTEARLIVAPVLTDSRSGLFDNFQSLDYMCTFLIQTAGIQSGLYYLCSGANLAYEKNAFIKANPYETNLNIASGDDIFLIQKFKKLFPGEIKVLKSNEAICVTRPEMSIRQFISQRLRWASKMKLSSNHSSLFLAGIIWFQKITALVFLVYSILSQDQNSILMSSGFLFLSIFLDFILLHSAASFFKKTNKLWWFLPAELIYSIYFVVIGILSWMPVSLKWKDRSI
ncbi:MAG: glycosyltransferase [Saprospiraceae bacterium]